MFATFRKLLLLFLGIPFLLLGFRFVADVGAVAWTYWQSADWPQTQALLLDVTQVSNPDQAWGNQTIVRYEYAVQGEVHAGTRICPSTDCPQPDLFATLRTALERGEPVPAWVNPDAPHTAFLFRHLHVPHLLLNLSVGLFCLFTGGSAVAFGIYMLRAQRRRPSENSA